MIRGLRRSSRDFPRALGAAIFLAQVALGILLFAVFQEYVPNSLASGQETGDAWGGYLLAAYGGARFVLETPTGAIADRIERRSALILGFLLMAPAICLMIVVETPAWFVVLAAALGSATAFLWPAAYAIAADRYPPARRGKVVGFLNAAQLLGFGAGALVGAGLVERWPRALIAVALGAILAAAVAATSGLPTTRALPGDPRERRGRLRTVMTSRLAGFSALILGSSMALSMAVPAIRPYGDDILDVSFASLTLALIPAIVVGAALYVPAGHLSDRMGRTTPFLLGQVLVVAGLLTVSETAWLPLAMLGATVVFAGNVLGVPALNAAIMDLAPQSHRATIIGFSVALSGLGLAAGPALGGTLVAHAGPVIAFRVAAVIAAVVGMGLLAYRRRWPDSTHHATATGMAPRDAGRC